VNRRGRPCRVDGEISTERIWAWLTPSERRALERCAREMHTDVAVIVRDAINDYVGSISDEKVFSVTGSSRASVS
jgi:hypothetical protein